MNKHLLLVPAALLALGTYAQNGKQRPTGTINRVAAARPIMEGQQNKAAGPKQVAKKAISTSAGQKTSSSSAATCTRFSTSANAFGFYQGGHEALHYNADINTIAFTHRASPNYSVAPNGNTGTIVQKYSTNGGSTWDSTAIWANTSTLGRYPQGGIYNPVGNTNVTNAYGVVMGEAVISNFDATYYASKKYTVPGNLTAGTDQQSFPNTAPFGALGKKIDFPRYGFSYTKDGYVRALGQIANDINNTSTNVGFGARGAAIMKGTFTAGAFNWSYDSLVPNVILRSDGSRHINIDQMDMAWNDAGTVGYVVMYGARAGSTGSMKGYQPLVYKTTNSGASWSLMPATDWTTNCFQGLVDRLWPVNTNSTLIVPFFTVSEGMDLAVDANDNLHMVTTVVGSSSTNNDSLDYTAVWGTNQYAWPETNLGYPTIYDFYTVGGTTSFRYHIVDSMQSEGCSGTSGYPGYAVNPWASAGTGIDARIQITHSPDRKKMFYSWTESDPTVAGSNFNIFPNLFMRGYDTQVDKVTPRVCVTCLVSSPANADQQAWFQYAANRSMLTNSVTNTNEIPFTISYNNTNDGNVPVDHYYLKGATFSQTDFTINKMTNVCTVGMNENSKPGAFDAICYPNPSNGIATISVKLTDNTDVTISIHNLVGALVKSVDVKGHSGDNNVTLDLTGLNAGVYVYTVKAGNAAVTKKLIIE